MKSVDSNFNFLCERPQGAGPPPPVHMRPPEPDPPPCGRHKWMAPNMRWIMERQLEYGKEVHICFIDYSKAFDCINHELLWKTLLEMGIPKHLIQLLKGLYEDQSVVI